jgi:hypothetical protein
MAHDAGIDAPPDGRAATDWIHSVGSPASESGTNVAVAPNGDVAIAGRFSSTIDLGGGTLTSNGENNIWVAAYRPDGTYLWSTRIGGSGIDFSVGLGFDAAGDLYIGGEFDGTVDFGGGPRASLDTGGFLVKLRGADGGYVWDHVLGTTIRARAMVTSIAALDSQTVVMGGWFNGSVDFGSGQVPRQSGAGSDAFVAAYSLTGELKWLTHLTSTGDIGTPAGLAVSEGDVFTGGGFAGTAHIGAATYPSAGSEDIWVARLRGRDGATVWAIRDGGPNDDRTGGIQSVAVSGGIVIVGGSFAAGTTLAGRSFVASGASDGFLSAYNATDGTAAWSTAVGGSGVDGVTHVAAHAGLATAALDYQGSVTLGSDTLYAASPNSSATGFARISPVTGGVLGGIVFDTAVSAELAYAADKLVGVVTFTGRATFHGQVFPNRGDFDVVAFQLGL